MINPYEPPRTPSRYIASNPPTSRRPLPAIAVWLLGLIVPGSPSLFMRPSAAGIVRFIVLAAAIPLAFVFFGPVWDLILFDGTPYDESGFYPFIAVCIAVPILSVWFGFRDRKRLLCGAKVRG